MLDRLFLMSCDLNVSLHTTTVLLVYSFSLLSLVLLVGVNVVH
jgi:hypothetical protein